MTTGEMKKWIDAASYEALLRRWRFAPAGGDPIFQGEVGDYYNEVMFKKRDALPAGEQVRASKAVGWEQPR
jgi:hypothetical protein